MRISKVKVKIFAQAGPGQARRPPFGCFIWKLSASEASGTLDCEFLLTPLTGFWGWGGENQIGNCCSIGENGLQKGK